MFNFNKTAIKILARENARLRSEVRRKDERIDELMDMIVHHKRPSRLERGTDAAISTAAVPSASSDAYLAAMKDAEERAERYEREQAGDVETDASFDSDIYTADEFARRD